MQFYKVRELLSRGVSLKDIKLRVTFYARVSTLKSDQLSSLDNQIDYFIKFIKSNPNWEYKGSYVDEGISGSSVKGRINFLKMIEDSKKDLFDLIITKEVSRFSRNLLDSIKYTQELMNNNVGVFFQTNGINTYDPNSEFILNMMSSLAQEEVKRLSSRVKWGAHNAIKRGRVLGSKTFGYYKKDTKLFIDEKESKIVKLIYNLYATNQFGLDKLALELKKRGYVNSKGNIYDASTLKNIIKNPKYKGYYQGHTTEVIDYKTKKRIKIDKNERIILKDESIPAIVSIELWDKANEILESRKTTVKQTKSQYAYSGLLVCFEHNKTFIRSTGSKRSINPIWACNDYMRYHLSACRSPLLKEKELDYIFKVVFSEIYSDTSILNELYSLYENTNNVKRLEVLNNQTKKLMDLYLNNLITMEEYQDKLSSINLEKKEINIKQDYKDIINKIYLEKNNIGLYIKTFIEKIIVKKIGEDRKNIILEVKLKNIEYDSSFNFELSNNYQVYLD